MSFDRVKLNRVEGLAYLEQDGKGILRISGSPPGFFEPKLIGRTPLEAVYLTQQISADSGVSHAMAAVTAWEAVTGLHVPENGRALRELLQNFSIIHAHLRHFYLQVLPDYLPASSLAEYEGTVLDLGHIKAGATNSPDSSWLKQGFSHLFPRQAAQRLWENHFSAMRVMAIVQKMMAMVGGKFPTVMSIVPGGVSLNLTREKVLRLRAHLNEVKEFLSDVVPGDVMLVPKYYENLIEQGKGSDNLLSVGGGVEDRELETSLFPSGVYFGGKLDRYHTTTTEGIHQAYYRLSQQTSHKGRIVVSAPDKSQAYTWVKSPKHDGRLVETGPLARLVITYYSGTKMRYPNLVEDMESLHNVQISKTNTVAGRIVARGYEVASLAERCELLLDQLDPAHPTISKESLPPDLTGEGLGITEAPAGAMQHRMVLEKGKIAYYDIITPSTWNGASRDENDGPGSLEMALNRERRSLDDPRQLRELSRIVQSFAFSMSDATH